MSPEEQCIAIAEACGWHNCGIGLTGIPFGHEPDYQEKQRTTGYPQFGKKLPDYLTDLNAMHEAEKVLTEQFKFGDYIAALWVVTGNKPSSANFWTEKNYKGFERCIHATAAQRAEAFLKTLGLWSTPAAKE